jgi:hypothetical protein
VPNRPWHCRSKLGPGMRSVVKKSGCREWRD